ncbi:MDIS1-interacting receptor like kinase 2-like [Cynara cardunculus var. scolymus]|uniref:MDIS1-interacting receptor like kinase 2-like n=1 Tax=Cynara cardunculus var. scolymus TaxID=59895 RepID=UPI000D62BD13|nr:MDIS1-interacting receptor like kinase 2-like [Cynara cardunculus var. scolymus]
MMMKKAFFPSTILLLTLFSTLSHDALGSVDALLRWKASLRSHNTTILLPSWTDQSTMSGCSWYGVSCDAHGSIRRLNLSSSGLIGTLDRFSFSSFPNLTHFELSLNYFSGIIPSEISYLSNLVYLDFSSNQFSGTIPPEIGHLRKLDTLHLFDNRFISGSIPEAI